MYILGAGGFAREVGLILTEQGVHIDGYLSDNPAEWNKLLTFGKVLGSIESVNAEHLKMNTKPAFVSGIGSPEARQRLVERALALGWRSLGFTLSPKAFFPTRLTHACVMIEDGAVICSGVSATTNIYIGRYVNVNLNCTLGHDSTILPYANLSPSVNISGNVVIEKGADIGTGAVILPHVRIGEGAIIGAGAVVNKDVPAGETWVGVPARKIK